MSASEAITHTSPAAAAPAARAETLRWQKEVAIVGVFYAVYTSVRNLFGSASASPSHAFANARHVIGIERALGLFHEERIQRWFAGWSWLLRLCNIFYGTFHFAVTIGVLVFLFSRRAEHYRLWRNTLAVTTALALIGFSAFPLMPPRLLGDCGEFGACATQYSFVDTLKSVGGLWSFDSGTMQSISNQYAAMPSLHFAWSSWCCLALWRHLPSRRVRIAALGYPLFTLFTIVVTANHYWIDAVGGAFVLAGGYAFARVGTSARFFHLPLTRGRRAAS